VLTEDRNQYRTFVKNTNEHLGSTKGRHFLKQVREYEVLCFTELRAAIRTQSLHLALIAGCVTTNSRSICHVTWIRSGQMSDQILDWPLQMSILLPSESNKVISMLIQRCLWNYQCNGPIYVFIYRTSAVRFRCFCSPFRLQRLKS
jgi:hypothetical protein